MSNKIAVAMSGGVDSSATAALLLQQGYEVIGITMQIMPEGTAPIEAAARVCADLGIEHYTIDLTKEFQEIVIDSFIADYEAGRTPNPCVVCNENIKFRLLVKKAHELGAAKLATGHYAQIIQNEQNALYQIHKGADIRKDQSYFLYRLTHETLQYVMMPLGGMTKTETRQLAQSFGLHVAEKADSQEICFIPDNDYCSFITKRRPDLIKAGEFRSSEDNSLLGKHNGCIGFTIGQRKGLGIALGKRAFVTRIDAAANTVYIGDDAEITSRDLVIGNVIFNGLTANMLPARYNVKIRSAHKEAPALVETIAGAADKLQITFDEPQRAMTAGQAAVIYDGDTVIGGGTIE